MTHGSIQWPKRPECFADALDYYLYLSRQEALVSDEVRRAIWDANPDGYSTGPGDRQAMLDLLIAFAVKERAA